MVTRTGPFNSSSHEPSPSKLPSKHLNNNNSIKENTSIQTEEISVLIEYQLGQGIQKWPM